MKQFMTGLLAGLAITSAQAAVAADVLPKDIAARVEAIPIQTLTISDEQFLKGDGPTAGVLAAGGSTTFLRPDATA